VPIWLFAGAEAVPAAPNAALAGSDTVAVVPASSRLARVS
jgi:hypothetical protein